MVGVHSFPERRDFYFSLSIEGHLPFLCRRTLLSARIPRHPGEFHDCVRLAGLTLFSKPSVSGFEAYANHWDPAATLVIAEHARKAVTTRAVCDMLVF